VQAREATGWPLAVAEEISVTAPPTDEELAALAALKAA
jgi:glutaconate CoA-transferase subunit B